MALSSPPFAMQNASHSAALFRQAVSSGIYTQGPISQTDFAVAAQGTPNMSVAVNPGQAWIKGTDIGNAPGMTWSTQGFYFALSDSSVTLSIATADTRYSRYDLVYLQITDTSYGGASNAVTLGVSTGTPSANPTTPSIPASAIGLARVTVAANATSITNSNITALSGPAALGFTTPVYASGYQAAAQTGLLANTWYTINYDTYAADTWTGRQVGGGWQAKFSGWHLISGTIGATNVTGIQTLAANVMINGAQQIGGVTTSFIDPGSTASQTSVAFPARLYFLAAGDIVTVQGFCSAAWNTYTGSGASTLTIARLYY